MSNEALTLNATTNFNMENDKLFKTNYYGATTKDF
jgi:hypothetical protein